MSYLMQVYTRNGDLLETIKFKTWREADQMITESEASNLQVRVWNSQNNLVYDSIEGRPPAEELDKPMKHSTEFVEQWIKDNASELLIALDGTADPIDYFAAVNAIRKALDKL